MSSHACDMHVTCTSHACHMHVTCIHTDQKQLNGSQDVEGGGKCIAKVEENSHRSSDLRAKVPWNEEVRTTRGHNAIGGNGTQWNGSDHSLRRTEGSIVKGRNSIVCTKTIPPSPTSLLHSPHYVSVQLLDLPPCKYMYLPVVTACCTLSDTQLAYLHIPCVHISLPQKCFYDPLHISLPQKWNSQGGTAVHVRLALVWLTNSTGSMWSFIC